MADDECQSENDAGSSVVMVALYYWYIDIRQKFLKDHQKFHQATCQELDLFGRIRISREGLNGVLSGTLSNLKEYENRLKKEVTQISTSATSEGSSRYGETLDVKYCHLRDELPVDKQKFDRLSVKVTKEVVSLNEAKAQSLEHYQPATHLSPQQWNEQLLQEKIDSDGGHGDGDSNSISDPSAIIIDARNVYESKIGHFRVENLPTLLTNTRKYSTIPSVFKASAKELSGKNVYMYCTGGVRCERASVYLQALANSEDWPDDLQKPKQIYQLQGGIQKYLEYYGSKEGISDSGQGEESSQEYDSESKIANDYEAGISAEHTTPQDLGKEPCLYAGRNFVFDQRRIDPIVGNNGKAVGRCIRCNCPHDDYDNGYAPSDNQEARCCRCRVLVLICDKCRPMVRIWGEENTNNGGEGEGSKPDLFCGGDSCINEGNEIEHAEVIRY